MASPLFNRIFQALVNGKTNSADITGATFVNGVYDSRSVLNPFLGNATSASRLFTPRTINGVVFDGSQDISITINEFTEPPTFPYFYVRNSAGKKVPVYLRGFDNNYEFEFGLQED